MPAESVPRVVIVGDGVLEVCRVDGVIAVGRRPHLLSVGFANRLLVMLRWLVELVTRRRGIGAVSADL